jgi:hypothetical protein
MRAWFNREMKSFLRFSNHENAGGGNQFAALSTPETVIHTAEWIIHDVLQCAQLFVLKSDF